MTRTLSDCPHHGLYLPIEDGRAGLDSNPCPLCRSEGIPLKHVSDISKAWKEGGTPAVQKALGGIPSSSASKRVSNLRRQFPELFPRKRAKVSFSRRRLLREALEIIESMPPSTALDNVIHLLKQAMPSPTRKEVLP